jgi:hypothetical protein
MVHSLKRARFTEEQIIGVLKEHDEIAPELTGQGLALRKCEAYDRPYDQHHGSC